MAVFPGSQSIGKKILKYICPSIAVNVISLINNVWRDLLWGCTLTRCHFPASNSKCQSLHWIFQGTDKLQGQRMLNLIPPCQSDPSKVRVSIPTFDPLCLLSREQEVLKICVVWFETHTQKSSKIWHGNNFDREGFPFSLGQGGSPNSDGFSKQRFLFRQKVALCISARLAANCCLVNQLPCSIEVSSFEPIPSSRVIRGQCSSLVSQHLYLRVLQKLFLTKPFCCGTLLSVNQLPWDLSKPFAS